MKYEMYQERHHYNELNMDVMLMDKMWDNENRWPTKRNWTDEECKALKDAIKTLTIRQQQVLALYLDGKKQIEIAKELGIGQSAVSLTFTGTKSDGGGIIKKLKKVVHGEQSIPRKNAVTIESIKAYAETYDFVCLDESYVDGRKTKMHFKCKNGHIGSYNYSYFKGKVNKCNKCKKNLKGEIK